jgi:hypothetical protein
MRISTKGASALYMAVALLSTLINGQGISTSGMTACAVGIPFLEEEKWRLPVLIEPYGYWIRFILA